VINHKAGKRPVYSKRQLAKERVIINWVIIKCDLKNYVSIHKMNEIVELPY